MNRLALALLGLLLGLAPAAAQDWPTKTVRIIVPFGPGSTPDIVGRLIADHLQQKLGQPFVIENRPGASGNTGTDMVAKAEPDGYTIGISLGGPLAINTLLFAKMPYDPGKDIALITMLATQPSALVVNASLGVNSVAELVDAAEEESRQVQLRLDRQRLAVASRHGGDRAQERHHHGAHPLSRLAAGDDRGAAQRRADGLPAGDRGDAARRVRPGEDPGASRSASARALLPDIPTLKEAGIDVEADAWNGLIAPARTPGADHREDPRARWSTRSAEPAIREKLATQLMEPIPTTPAQFRAKIDADLARWAPVIKAIDLKIN